MPKARLAYIDSLLLSKAEVTWGQPARVVGHVFVQLLDEGLGQTGDAVLFARLRTLIKAGLIEKRGDPSHIRYCEIRLPDSEAATQTD